ncbi:MAG: hypothetical protein ACRDD1_19015, partial [Planctomycetia bacterium]
MDALTRQNPVRGRAAERTFRLESLEDRSVPALTVVQVADISVLGSRPTALTNLNGVLIFEASGNGVGREVFRSDGTAAGTSLIKDINPGNDSGAEGTAFFSEALPILNGFAYFIGDDPQAGRELWKTNGTEGGTSRVIDLAPGPDDAFFGIISDRQIVEAGGFIYFIAGDGQNGPFGEELWKTDGTANGTTLVADVLPGNGGGTIISLGTIGDRVVFSTFVASNGAELFVTDGTPAGTLPFAAANGARPSQANSFTEMNGFSYFSAGSDFLVFDRVLWKSDGTTSGTSIVADLYPGAESSAPSGLTAINGILYFAANSPGSGFEVFTYQEGGVPVKQPETAPGPLSSVRGQDDGGVTFAEFGGRIYFG